MKEITEFKYIPIQSISFENDTNKNNLDIDEIINEIKDKGLIRPLIVSKEKDKFILKLGIRRFMAFKKLNYDNIFCGIIDGTVELEEIKAIALCYTELDDMLSFEDKTDALNFLIKEKANDLNKVSSITNIPIDEIKTILNKNELIESIVESIVLRAKEDKEQLVKKLSQSDPKNLIELNNLLREI